MTPEEAEAYRRSILDALGDDDPISVQVAEADHWRRLIDLAAADVRTRPAEGEWCVLECLGHLVDSELVTSARYRWILAEDRPPLQGYEQPLWVAALDHRNGDPAALIELFSALRRANVDLWRRTSPSGRARVGMHAERGPESFELLFRMQAGHGRVHRDQAERALAAVRRGPVVG